MRPPAGGLDHHLLAARDFAACHRPGITAEIEMRPVHPLHREAKRPLAPVTTGIDRLQMPEQSRAAIPVHMRAGVDHVVALERRHRNGGDLLEAELGGKGGKILGDRLEPRLIEIDQVHLVDGKRHLADAEQRQDAGMAARLGQDAAARIDQQHGEIAIGRAGRHVARVLDVARRVGDDEFPPRRREIAIGDVDGDLLLALGLQPVDQQREIERRRLARAGDAAPRSASDPRRPVGSRTAGGRSACSCRRRRCRR